MNDSTLSALLERESRRLTQTELARRLGVSKQTVSRWLQTRIPAERVIEVERALEGRVTRKQLRPDLYT